MFATHFPFLALFASALALADVPLHTEDVPAAESAAMTTILKLTEDGFVAAKASPVRPVTRDAHAKHHGCVRGKFQVLTGIPDELREGVFAYNTRGNPRIYDAWIRFSNGNAKPQHDWIPDGRGMAIKLTRVAKGEPKLMNDERATQDFLMINFPEFFIRNAKDYAEFMTLTQQGRRAEFFASEERAKTEGRIAAAVANQFTTSPLETSYFSMVPVRLGKLAVKYSVAPCSSVKSTQVGDLDLRPLVQILGSVKKPEELKEKAAELAPYNDYLSAGLAAQLGQKESYCFDFYVQPQFDPATDLVEDATSHWTGPQHRIARLTIEPQGFQSKQQGKFCENLSFTPWHSLSAHQPLGGIQRVRKAVYARSSKLRHEANIAPEKEPTGREKF